jgi:hypothetical protein
MKITLEQRGDFLALRPLPGVALLHNDLVSVLRGEHAGNAGSVISVEELGKDPMYLIELESGIDALLPQSSLNFVAHGH